jgi:hypothetical protein
VWPPRINAATAKRIDQPGKTLTRCVISPETLWGWYTPSVKSKRQLSDMIGAQP